MKVVSKGLFAVAAAVSGAALMDPLVEALSNAHLFGPGVYTDRSNADVIPALAVGAVLLAIFVVLGVARMLRHETAMQRWLRASTEYLDPVSIRCLLPAIFALQLGVLFTMETLEQWFVWGHVLGGMLWIGAPLIIGLLLHACGCVVVSITLSRVSRILAKRIYEAVRLALQCIVLRRNLNCVRHLRRESVTPSQLIAPFIERLKGRAPPQTAV